MSEPITKGELYNSSFSHMSRNTFNKIITDILPNDWKHKHYLYPKHVKMINDEMGIDLVE